MPAKVAIVGAGLAGLTLARRLSSAAEVVIFDKSRGAGGRMATRYADPYRFDHGTQHFTARGPAFQAFVKPLLENGLIAPWRARFTELNGVDEPIIREWGEHYPHYVGVPGMNQVGKFLAEGLTLHLDSQVGTIKGEPGNWQLLSSAGDDLGRYDWVISTAPAEQTATLMPADFAHGETVASVQMLSCYALMLGLATDFDRDYDIGVVKNADISWVAVNSTKPGRGAEPCVLVHASNAWADANLAMPIEEVRQHLQEAVLECTGWSPNIEHSACHRWRYANIDKQDGPLYYNDPQQQLAACGDWCIRGRVESAFTSASELAGELEQHLAA